MSERAFQLRFATAKDIGQLISIRQEYCDALEERGLTLAPHDPESTRRYCYTMMGNREARVLVAADDDSMLLGVLMFQAAPYPINQGVIMGVETMLYVREAWRKHGIGTALFDRAESILRDAGVSFFVCSYRVGLQDVEWFEKRGYALMEPTVVKRLRD